MSRSVGNLSPPLPAPSLLYFWLVDSALLADDTMADPLLPPPSPPSPPRRHPLASAPPTPHLPGRDRPSAARLNTADLASASSTRSSSPEPEPLATPTLAQSYGQLRKSLSLSNLAQLAHDKDRVRSLSTHIYRRGSRIDRRSYKPKDDDEVLAHALRGGIR